MSVGKPVSDRGQRFMICDSPTLQSSQTIPHKLGRTVLLRRHDSTVLVELRSPHHGKLVLGPLGRPVQLWSGLRSKVSYPPLQLGRPNL